MYYPMTSSISNGLVALYGSDERIINNNNNNNNRIINSTNKMKTTWNIIKAETNRLKGPITTTINNNKNSPEAFNKYLFSITENILQDVKYTNKQGHNINKNLNYYLLNQFHKPFPSIKSKNTSPK